MTRLALHLRLIAVLAVLLAIGGFSVAPVAAQDPDATPTAEESAPPEPPPLVVEPAPTEPPPAVEEPAPIEAPPPPPVETPTEPVPTEETVPPAVTEPVVTEPVVSEPDPEPEQEAGPTSSPNAGTSSGSRAARDVSAAAESDATVNVTIAAFDCAVAPVGNTPGQVPAECTAAPGVSFSVTADAVELGTFVAGADGIIVILVPDGAELVVVEDLTTETTGFSIVGTGTQSLTVSGPIGLSFVHVADGGPVVENAGRLQLSQGSCPTLGEERTELRYIAPRSIQAQAEGSGCGPVAGSDFRIEGGDFPAGGVTKTTDAAGNWRGEVTEGVYTVTHVGSGQSIEIDIVEDDITVIVAIDYVTQVSGTISVRRYLCGGDEDGTTISIASTEPAPSDGCTPSDGIFQLSEGEAFTGSGDGAITFPIPTGTYLFSDLTVGDGTSAEIQIAEGATTWVLVEHVISGGDISVLYNFCGDATGDPDDAAFWASTCVNPFAGANLKLISSAGAVVAEATTDDAGVATFPNVVDGTYRIRGGGDRATCAVFVGGQAAFAGFQIASGQLYQSQVFGCAKAAGNPGGENPGGENPGGENPGGENPGGETPGNGAPGNGSGSVTTPPATAPSAAPNLVPGQMVTQLPSTGVAGVAPAGSPLTMIALAFAALLLAVGAGVGLGFERRR